MEVVHADLARGRKAAAAVQTRAHAALDALDHGLVFELDGM
jgi:hypothetical protein